MARPLLFRIFPKRLKTWLYYRRYHTRHAVWRQLFDAAPLAQCPNVSMYRLILGDVISGNIAFAGFYEWDLSRRIAGHAPKGGLFVDVGANMGYFSLLWAGLNPSGRAVAIEASPRNIELLRNNVVRNHLNNRITVVPKAAGDRAGTISFEAGPVDQTGWGGISRDTSANTLTVPMVRLDEELPDTTIDVLKIDVEGADTLVLRGCEALLKNRRIQTIYFEQNLDRMKGLGLAPGDAQDFLRGLGYKCHSLGNEQEWIAYPQKAWPFPCMGII